MFYFGEVIHILKSPKEDIYIIYSPPHIKGTVCKTERRNVRYEGRSAKEQWT